MDALLCNHLIFMDFIFNAQGRVACGANAEDFHRSTGGKICQGPGKDC
jgi:hypothetical protein